MNKKSKIFCDICRKEVKNRQGSFHRKEWFINAAVVGSCIPLEGHRVCLQNVDKLIVIPNRIQFIVYQDILDQKRKLEGNVASLN
jgi:hypothetical protein